MKTSSFRIPSRREGGAIAVEMAIVLPIQVLLITALVLFAQIFFYYGIMQKASYNAARILSTATQVEMRTTGAGNSAAPVAQLVRAIAEQETSIMDNNHEGKFIDVQCDFSTCGLSVPATVRVSIRMRMPFPILGGQSLLLTSDVTMRYAGN